MKQTADPAKRIEGRAKTVRELLSGVRYSIDTYQREYAWEERQVRELVDDLASQFLSSYESNDSREQVEYYGRYFLGSIVISNKNSRRFIVDGQQRLTSLTLLLLQLKRFQQEQGFSNGVDVDNLIYSGRFGKKEFNLDIPDRSKVMRALMDGKSFDPANEGTSVRTILERYSNIADHLPEEITSEALFHFTDWLMENVDLVVIEAYSDEDAYTIFETMNDRGLSLTLPDMLKGYILAQIDSDDDQIRVNDLWKKRMQDIKDLGQVEESDLFKNWFRAHLANSMRQTKKGAQNQDYERIGTEFHRWIRERREQIGLHVSSDFVRLVETDLDFFATRFIEIRKAARELKKGWESIRYIEDRGFTLQTQAMLAAIHPDDKPIEFKTKIALVADFLDIWIARRVWNFRTIGYSSVRYALFNLTKECRKHTAASLAKTLLEKLDEQPERFDLGFRLHKQNKRQVRHILARLTDWVEQNCGKTSMFEQLVSRGRKREFEIEHIWPRRFELFSHWFDHEHDFALERNNLGGLLLLPPPINQAINDSPFEDKLTAYLAHSENLLAKSLHRDAYQKTPRFRALIKEYDLEFCPLEKFGPSEQQHRQKLYMDIAKLVWDPKRLEVTANGMHK